ncbi:MFS transporter [Saccharopolyspora flava]|uniref:Predicted arabinose efflux permease, MFS family n=1 Tax=Saccharopolyspora flava TaxID=95161 RepID=A0A1I6PPW1_9PSEU|nr:MFS transporter [Saccharopolyspora flava]SFS42249.1 Predicted arabinose efflux permease, MFS family [Saccharopolyspora flava]
MTSGLLARLHIPAQVMVLTFLIADWTGSYAIGGAVCTAMTLGHSIAGPVRGRAADRSSVVRVLVVSGGVQFFGFAAMIATVRWVDAAHWWLMLPVSLATGLAAPPLAQVARSMWPHIASGEAREAAYAVEATLQELLYVVAPMLATFAVAAWNPSLALACLAVWAVVGPVLFASALWRAGIRGGLGGGAPARSGGLLRLPGFLSMMCFFTLIVGALVSVDLVLVGWARGRGAPELAGFMAMAWAVGSLVGGLVMGGFPRSRLWLRCGLAALGLCALAVVLPPVAPGSPWLVGGVLLLGGAAIAPLLAASNGRLADLAPPERRGEAFGWTTTASTAGIAIANPLVGSMMDFGGPAAAGATCAGLAVLAFAVVLLHLRRAGTVSPVAEVVEKTADRRGHAVDDLPR